jgi:hypothetical protein
LKKGLITRSMFGGSHLLTLVRIQFERNPFFKGKVATVGAMSLCVSCSRHAWRAWEWYAKPPRSIRSFPQLAGFFLERFGNIKDPEMDCDSLIEVRKGPNRPESSWLDFEDRQGSEEFWWKDCTISSKEGTASRTIAVLCPQGRIPNLRFQLNTNTNRNTARNTNRKYAKSTLSGAKVKSDAWLIGLTDLSLVLA